MAGEEIKPKELNRAKQYVYRLLKIRLRSCLEIEIKLKQKDFSDKIIVETIQYFQDTALLNDQNFTRLWISSRLKKPYGINRIKSELIAKGIQPDILQTELDSVLQNYNESKIIRTIIAKKKFKQPGVPIDIKKQRIYNFLLRRGFRSTTVLETLRKYADN